MLAMLLGRHLTAASCCTRCNSWRAWHGSSIEAWARQLAAAASRPRRCRALRASLVLLPLALLLARRHYWPLAPLLLAWRHLVPPLTPRGRRRLAALPLGWRGVAELALRGRRLAARPLVHLEPASYALHL